MQARHAHNPLATAHPTPPCHTHLHVSRRLPPSHQKVISVISPPGSPPSRLAVMNPAHVAQVHPKTLPFQPSKHPLYPPQPIALPPPCFSTHQRLRSVRPVRRFSDGASAVAPSDVSLFQLQTTAEAEAAGSNGGERGWGCKGRYHKGPRFEIAPLGTPAQTNPSLSPPIPPPRSQGGMHASGLRSRVAAAYSVRRCALPQQQTGCGGGLKACAPPLPHPSAFTAPRLCPGPSPKHLCYNQHTSLHIHTPHKNSSHNASDLQGALVSAI